MEEGGGGRGAASEPAKRQSVRIVFMLPWICTHAQVTTTADTGSPKPTHKAPRRALLEAENESFQNPPTSITGETKAELAQKASSGVRVTGKERSIPAPDKVPFTHPEKAVWYVGRSGRCSCFGQHTMHDRCMTGA